MGVDCKKARALDRTNELLCTAIMSRYKYVETNAQVLFPRQKPTNTELDV
jgi:hypothetical protein